MMIVHIQKVCQFNITTGLSSDGQQFHQYQQINNHLSPQPTLMLSFKQQVIYIRGGVVVVVLW